MRLYGLCISHKCWREFSVNKTYRLWRWRVSVETRLSSLHKVVCKVASVCVTNAHRGSGGVAPLIIPRVSSVKTQLFYCQLKWRRVSTHRVVIRPIIEPGMRYSKWKCTLLGSQNVYNSERTWIQMRLIFTVLYTGLFEMIVGVLTTCHTQYTWNRSICIFLFNRTTLRVFVTYLTCALYVHPL